MFARSLIAPSLTVLLCLQAGACSGGAALAGEPDALEDVEQVEGSVEGVPDPVCGNGLLEMGEECDDGNAGAWDGCSACGITEFQVNTVDAGKQWDSSAAIAPGGHVLAVWRGLDASGWGVRGQCFCEEGVREGEEFLVNVLEDGNQRSPAVAATGEASFVVVWQSHLQDGDGWGVFGRMLDAGGAGPEFQINTFTAGDQVLPEVAAAGDGRFVVVWVSDGQDGDDLGLFGQRFDASGARTGSEFQINVTVEGAQSAPSLACGGDGGFVVAWQGEGEGSDVSVFTRRFDAAGRPVGGETRVEPLASAIQVDPAVAVSHAGEAVVAWSELDTTFRGDDAIVCRLFDERGEPLGDAFLAHAGTEGDRSAPTVAADDEGRLVVAWQGEGLDGDEAGVIARLFGPGMEPWGWEFQVNGYAENMQWDVTASMSGDGRFLLVWSSDGQDGDTYGIFAQRYDPDGVPRGLLAW